MFVGIGMHVCWYGKVMRQCYLTTRRADLGRNATVNSRGYRPVCFEYRLEIKKFIGLVQLIEM